VPFDPNVLASFDDELESSSDDLQELEEDFPFWFPWLICKKKDNNNYTNQHQIRQLQKAYNPKNVF